MKTRVEIRPAAIGSLVATAAFVAGVTLAGSTALAQVAGLYGEDNPYVSVDMSVLEAGSSAAAAKSFPEEYTGPLKVPGPAAPMSQLYVKPTGNGSPLPPPEKGRVAMTPPAGPAMPPVEPPESTIAEAPTSPAEPAPAPAPKPAAAPPKPAMPAAAKPQAPAAAAPPPKPAVAAAPPQPAKAPPPPAVEPPSPPAAKPEPPAVEPPKTDMAAAEPKDQPKEQASLPPSGAAIDVGNTVRVVFEAGASKLPEEARDKLKAIVEGISDQSNLRLQLLAYAGGESLSSSKARRLSLSRALSVRSYLIESGLRSTRIDVRALGNKTTDEPVNRVDINIVER